MTLESTQSDDMASINPNVDEDVLAEKTPKDQVSDDEILKETVLAQEISAEDTPASHGDNRWEPADLPGTV